MPSSINGAATPQSTAPLKNGRIDLQVPKSEDDATIRSKYRPYLLDDDVATTDWVSKLELDTVESMVQSDLTATGGNRIKVLVLYGSLRSR